MEDATKQKIRERAENIRKVIVELEEATNMSEDYCKKQYGENLFGVGVISSFAQQELSKILLALDA